jgi:hypothetical protein
MWQDQPEFHRLKYASPLTRAPTYFKQCNPSACRVTSRWTIECRIKQGTSHEGESRDTITVIFYIIGLYFTWVVKSNISFKLIGFITNRFKFSSLRQQNLNHNHCTRRQYGYHAKPGMISLGRISVSRGRVPLHGPTIGQSVRPWHRQSRPWHRQSRVTIQDWVF